MIPSSLWAWSSQIIKDPPIPIKLASKLWVKILALLQPLSPHMALPCNLPYTCISPDNHNDIDSSNDSCNNDNDNHDDIDNDIDSGNDSCNDDDNGNDDDDDDGSDNDNDNDEHDDDNHTISH